MKKKILSIFASLMLISCTSQYPELFPGKIKFKPTPLPAISVPLLMPPKLKTINWKISLSPMVQKMLRVDGINDGSILLVNTMKNATNGSVQINKATAELTELIIKAGNKFRVINAIKLNAARQRLGLFIEDSLESRSKAVGLARYLNAQYMLYSTASGNIKTPTLDLQLMLVKTGEIVWSGHGVAHD
ncbi:penicillin-binding protein activator LpoB [Candidatus Steffania adelgidicola]|uniref:penicillin-binding protein activator LpoB n=1 Tax=Candidatus Steffania adelgidicola TaxID=1076626 RepID=UPI001D009855|nr:penicillin-binding protein activator LpoB [Candidatus Steffania adelgidicola]UDG79638.1 Penicillin-binding protein activator LpoB [Candidatus Steffania adelgidicola]